MGNIKEDHSRNAYQRCDRTRRRTKR